MRDGNNHRSQGIGTVIAAFAAGAIAATVAGGYYLFGPNGRRHRREAERWIEDAKDEILTRMEDAKDMTQEAYEALVDEVTEDYTAARDLASGAARKFSRQMKSQYRDMRVRAKRATRKAGHELEDDELDE